MTNLDAYGKHTSTSFDIDIISEELANEIRKEFYKKPTKEEVIHEMRRILNGFPSMTDITEYYVRDLMWDCVRHDCVYSVNEAMNDTTLLSYAYYTTHRRDGFYRPEEQGDAEAIKRYFAMGGKAFAGSVAQFPLRTMCYILDTYNTNNEYYDFSCGWGCRLTGAMSRNINYYGTDPNYMLVPQLEKLANDWKEECNRTSTVDIRCQGSEHFVPEWEGKMGLAFSSTPYFKLEDYIYGDQSCRKDTYEDWVNEYLRPTIENIYKYLTDTGYFLLNIKDYNEYPMEADVQRIAEETGFELEGIDDLNLCTGSNRPKGNGEYMLTTEPMFVFHKKGFIPTPINGGKTELW